MTLELLPRQRRVLAPGAVHVPDWLDLERRACSYGPSSCRWRCRTSCSTPLGATIASGCSEPRWIAPPAGPLDDLLR
jgi:hypothetical protein